MRRCIRPVVWFVVAMIGATACWGQTPGELGVAGPVMTPLQHRSYWRLERELFGYQPGFVPGVVTFDLQNRPFVRAGQVIQTLDDQGQWVELDPAACVHEEYPDWDGKFGTGPSAEEHVAFDESGDAYTIINATRSSVGQVLLLHSQDGGHSWVPYPIGKGFVRMERLDGHNDFSSPPPILLYMSATPGVLQLILPEKLPDGTLDVSTVVDVSDDSLLVPNHSGGGNSLCSQGSLVHMVWPGRTPVPGGVGTPEYAATYNRETGTLTEPVLLGFGGTDVSNPHNLPAIAADSEGMLHVVLGAHHDPFRYTKSLEPRSTTGGWTEPVEFGAPKLTPSEGSYTYTGWVCDAEDTLHCVARWAGDGYRFRLSYVRKPRDGEWEVRPHLVIPFAGNYSVYYHKLNLDRRGRLFVSYEYTRAARFDDEVAAHTKKHPLADPDLDFIIKDPSLLVSDDGGDSWRLAVTDDMQPDAEGPEGPAVAGAPEASDEVEDEPLPATLLRQLGGAFHPIAVDGNLACVGVGNSLVLLDVSDPSQMSVIGQTSPLEDEVQDIQIQLPYVYVAAWRDGFVVYDISEPSEPRVVAHDASTEGRGFELVGDTVYLTASKDGLRVLDATEPEKLRETGRLSGIEAYDVEVLGQWAYVATGSYGVKLVDVGDPGEPKAVKDLFRPADFSDRVNTAWELTRDGNELYISPGPSNVALRVFDLSTPGNPQELAQVGEALWGWGRLVAVSDEVLFLAGLDGMHMLDMSDPAEPRELGVTTDRIKGVAVNGDYTYTTGESGVTAYDAGDPAQPQVLGSYQTPRMPFNLAVAGQRAYLADWKAGVQVFDVGKPTVAESTGDLREGEMGSRGGGQWGVRVRGRGKRRDGCAGCRRAGDDGGRGRTGE